MDKTLTAICDYLNNYFWRQKIEGKFTISNGLINATGLQNGQYFRVIGSTFNDGVHKYPTDVLQDEEFTGAVWSMAVPATVIDLAKDINDWITLYGGVSSPAMSPYTSESFGNYSYSKGSKSGGSGSADGWQNAFANRLAPYRRLRGAR